MKFKNKLKPFFLGASLTAPMLLASCGAASFDDKIAITKYKDDKGKYIEREIEAIVSNPLYVNDGQFILIVTQTATDNSQKLIYGKTFTDYMKPPSRSGPLGKIFNNQESLFLGKLWIFLYEHVGDSSTHSERFKKILTDTSSSNFPNIIAYERGNIKNISLAADDTYERIIEKVINTYLSTELE